MEPVMGRLDSDQLVLMKDDNSVFIDCNGNPTHKQSFTWSDNPVYLGIALNSARFVDFYRILIRKHCKLSKKRSVYQKSSYSIMALHFHFFDAFCRCLSCFLLKHGCISFFV